MIRNLQTRFILFIILIATFSGCFSLVLSYLFYGNSIENTMKQNQTKIAQNILLLHNETDFPLEKIISIDFTNEYELTVLDDISNYKTSDKTQNSNIIYCENSLFHEVTTIVKVENKYVVISNKPKNNLFFYIMINSLTAISSTLLFISIIITMFSKKFLMPIRSLNYATGEVSKGNFKIQLPIPNDFELGSLTAKFNVMVRELNSIETLRNDFISNVSHEIKTPISALSLALENNNDFRLKQEVDKINQLVEQMLYYARSENTEKDYFVKEIQLAEIIHSVILKYRHYMLNKKITLNVHDLDHIVITDEKWLVFIISQIIQNSIKYLDKDKKEIEVWGENNNNYIDLIIKDNGCGIKEADLVRIFEKGFTGTNRKKGYSTGMGLYLTKKSCDKLGLKLQIQSKEKEFTKLTITFPKSGLHKIEN